ncbi:MAG TPA: hypothetical protein VMT34_11020 [Aggregatilineales bacterium]|nr:hypothetical protein [Aggregatilineales bacterium]
MSNDELTNLLRAGIQAAKDKDKAEARRLLEQVIEKDETNETAWMWLATVVETPREQRICLENVLEINPRNERAKQMLEKLRPSPITGNTSSTVRSTPPPTPAPTRAVTSKPLPDARPAPARRAAVGPGGRPRMNRTVFIGGIALALALIVVGVGLLISTGNAPAQPSNTPARGVSVQTLILTRFPVSPTLETTPPTRDPNLVVQLPPTWTPVPSDTPRPGPTSTPTLPPISRYMLVYVGEGRGQKNPALFSTAAAGGKEQILIGGDATDVSFSPDGKKIAYVIGTSSASPQIGVANADGSNPQTITTMHARHIRSPNWSPDGVRIVFSSDEPGTDQLYTMTPEGHGVTQITNEKYPSLFPSYSPDGKKIVYSADPTRQGSLQLYVLDLSTGTSTAMTESQGNNSLPMYSPAGNLITFVSTRDGHSNIYTIEADGVNENLVTFDDNNAENRDPSWSPDGKYILFASNRNGGVFNLFVMTPDGGMVQQITNNKENTYGARFRPNGA